MTRTSPVLGFFRHNVLPKVLVTLASILVGVIVAPIREALVSLASVSVPAWVAVAFAVIGAGAFEWLMRDRAWWDDGHGIRWRLLDDRPVACCPKHGNLLVINDPIFGFRSVGSDMVVGGLKTAGKASRLNSPKWPGAHEVLVMVCEVGPHDVPLDDEFFFADLSNAARREFAARG